MAEGRGTHLGSHQALPVPDGEPDWDIETPQTAEEYLKRVRCVHGNNNRVITP